MAAFAEEIKRSREDFEVLKRKRAGSSEKPSTAVEKLGNRAGRSLG